MPTDLDWILGLSLMVGLAFFMTSITYKDTDTFFIWLTVFSGFVVWSGLIDLWVLIVCLVLLGFLIGSKIRKGGKSI